VTIGTKLQTKRGSTTPNITAITILITTLPPSRTAKQECVSWSSETTCSVLERREIEVDSTELLAPIYSQYLTIITNSNKY